MAILDSGSRQNVGKRRSGRANKNGDYRGCVITHGMSDTRIYSIWCDMKRRCYNEKNKRYNRYGGRGISVCEEWRNNFNEFYEWSMSNGYSDKMSIDRINVDGDYAPENCRWITPAEQQKNTSRTHYITAFGKTMCMSDWARECGISADVLRGRINKLGWTDEDAVSVPLGAEKRKYGNKR